MASISHLALSGNDKRLRLVRLVSQGNALFQQGQPRGGYVPQLPDIFPLPVVVRGRVLQAPINPSSRRTAAL